MKSGKAMGAQGTNRLSRVLGDGFGGMRAIRIAEVSLLSKLYELESQ